MGQLLCPALARIGGLPPEAVRPDSMLKDVLPDDLDGEDWASLRQELEMVVPSLGWPPWARGLVLAAILLACAAGGAALVGWVGPLTALSIGSGAVLVVVALRGVSSRLQSRIPGDLTTVGDLADRIVHLSYKELEARLGPPSEDEVREAVREIVADQLGVEKVKVVPAAEFVRDLGLA